MKRTIRWHLTAPRIAANHVRRIDLDEDWKRYGGAR